MFEDQHSGTLYQVLKKHKWKWEVSRSVYSLRLSELRKGTEKEIKEFHRIQEFQE